MKDNLIAAGIIGIAIIAGSFVIAYQSSRAARSSFQVEETLAKIEDLTKAKDGGKNSRLATIMKALSGSLADGFRAGFEEMQVSQDKKLLSVRDKLTVKEIKIVPGQMSNKERVVGILRNESDKTLSGITLSVIYKDAEGKLMDVTSKFTEVKGVLKPGDEIGFECERDLGEFSAPKEELAKNKASSAVVTVTSLRFVTKDKE